MKIEIEVDNIEEFAIAFNNACVAYGDIISSAYFGCDIPEKFKKLLLTPEELNDRYECLINVYKQITKIEEKIKNND